MTKWDALRGFFKTVKLSSGLTPVIRLETSKRLTTGTIGDKIIENQFPYWIRIEESDSGIFGLLKKKIGEITRSVIADFLGGVSRESPVLGIMIDEGYTNPYRFIANVIFQDVLKQSPKGNEWLSSSHLTDLGFPLRITIGFMTTSGAFKQHPYDDAISVPKQIEPNYTGVVSVQTKEVMTRGDRFQITCVGFEYLLAREDCGEFSIGTNEYVDKILARLMIRWMTGSDVWDASAVLLRPIPILKAMGMIDPKTEELKSLIGIQKAIQFIDTGNNVRTRNNMPVVLEPMVIRDPMGGPPIERLTYYDVLKQLRSKDLTGHEIYFDNHGRLTVQGRDKVWCDDIVLKTIPNVGDRTRVHDCVIGSNSLHIEANSDIENIASTVTVINLDPWPLAKEPGIVPIRSEEAAALFIPLVNKLANYVGGVDDDIIRYYGGSFGSADLFYYDRSEEIDGNQTFQLSFAESMAEKYKYWGMRGSSYMIANPGMRVGDVLRITDIRDKEGIGFNLTGIINLGKEAVSAVKKYIDSKFTLKGLNEIKRRHAKLGLGVLDDYYYIWKVRHYVGGQVFTSKAFFVKEPFSLVTTSELYRLHMNQRRIRTSVGEDSPAS